MTTYDDLVRSGAIASCKRDILLEATDDSWYVCHIHAYFAEEAGVPADAVVPCTVRLVRELESSGYTYLAEFAESGEPMAAPKSEEGLFRIVSNIETNPFQLFLIATDAGRSWVEKYEQLLRELSPRGSHE